MNDDLLFQRFLDGRLSREESDQLNRRLREDPVLREELWSIADQAVALGDMARVQRGTAMVAAGESFSKTAERRAFLPVTSWIALAASIAVLAVGAWFFRHSTPVSIATLVESTGTVAWAHGDPVQAGDPLTAGTLETVGEASSALLRFRDGTLITLHGETELSFAEDGQKILSLTRGMLSAEVKPQPSRRPMLIRTPSAVAEVVGTTFDLTARSEDTLLKVDEGLVKLKRLADGSQVEVPASSSAVASLDANATLDAAATPEPLTEWSFDFSTTEPPRDWRGYAKDGVMHATPYVAKKHPDGSVTTHFGVSVRTAMLEQPLRLLATDSSVIRYRLQMERPASLQLMLLTHKAEGGFGGNFECKIGEEELRPDGNGWCEIAIPIDRYEPIDRRAHIRDRHPTASGNIITSAILSTYRDDRKLVVARFELSSHP